MTEMEEREFKSFFKDLNEGNEARRCNYTTRLDTYGCGCAHDCRYCLVIPLGFIHDYFKSSLLEGADAIPEGHYASENMKSTVVPFRNGIMLSIACGIAESRGLTKVMIANHGGDHAIYPDCREGFIDAISRAMTEGTYIGVRIVAPYTNITKADIAARGAKLGVDYSRTWSCYKGGEKHCGKCGTCVERKEAFALAGVPDPTEYEE